MLDAIAGGLRELPSVHLKELPRMADYAEWGEAIGRGLGWGAETFLSTYNDNRKAATDPLLDDSPVAAALLALGPRGVDWSGTPAELYRAASKIAGNNPPEPAGPNRSTRSAPSCAGSLRKSVCTDSPSSSNGSTRDES